MITEEQITKLKEAHPGAELHQIFNADTGVDVIVKAPSESEWKRFNRMRTDPDQRALCMETLFRACLVYPSPQDFAPTLARLPGLAETFGSELVDIAGVSRTNSRKKL